MVAVTIFFAEVQLILVSDTDDDIRGLKTAAAQTELWSSTSSYSDFRRMITNLT